MKKIGIDFDNTIVCYDELFYKIAYEKNLIPEEVEKTKIAVRDYLRKNNKDHLFTLLQGEVYGNRILEASPAPGVINAIKDLIKKGVEIYIVSHKSKYPFKGPKYNLHKSAMNWLEKNNLCSINNFGIKKSNVFFNPSKELKVQKISKLGCNYFIDDLPEILKLIDKKVIKIHYSPSNKLYSSSFVILKNWESIKEIIFDE